MSGPWEDFAPAEDAPWADFQTAKPKRKSQSLGFMEGVARPLENAGKVNPLNYISLPGDRSRETRAQAAQGMHDYFAKREQTEQPGTIGKIAGNVLATIPVGMATGNPWIGGAVGGALTSESDSLGGVAKDAAVGAVLGKATDVAVNAAAKALKPVVDPAVQLLEQSGVKLTPGMKRGGKAMAREDKLMSKPIVGDAIAADRQATIQTFNKAAVNKALAPLGVKVPDDVAAGFDAVGYAHDAVDQAYNSVVPKMAVQVDPRFMVGMRKVAQDASTMPEAQQAQLQAALKGIRFGQNSRLAGQQLKDAQAELSRLAKTYSSSASPADRELGRALWAVKGNLDDLMMRQNPQLAPELRKANAAFRGLAIVEDAAGRADDGVFNTGQLKQSVRRGDASRRKAASARGDAYMQDFSNAARNVIPAKTPDSGTAGRLNQGNVLAAIGGAVDRGRYEAGKVLDNVLAAPRPAWAEPAANALLKLRPYLVVNSPSLTHQAVK